MNLKNRIGLAIVLALVLTLGLAMVVSAGGLRRWVKSGAVIYDAPDDVVSQVVTTTVGFQLVEATLDSNGWAKVEFKGGQEGYVKTSDLLRDEPSEAKTVREQQEEAAFLKASVSDQETGKFLAYLMRVLADMGFNSAGVAQKAQVETPEANVPSTYVVQPKDSLSKIGIKLGVDWKAIVQANGIVPPYTITVGQILVIPTGTTTAAPAASMLSAWPTTAQSVAEMIGLVKPGEDYVAKFPNLQIVSIVGDCPGTWSVRYPDGHYFGSIPATNTTSCHQDGQMADGSIGVPAGASGVMGLTLRPCSCYGK